MVGIWFLMLLTLKIDEDTCDIARLEEKEGKVNEENKKS